MSDDGWHRLHPLSPLVRTGRLAIVFFAILVPPLLAGGRNAAEEIRTLVIFGLVLVGGLVSWLVTRWRVEDGTLRIETGLVRRRSLRFPLQQVQAIDTVRPGLARALGLSELRLRMAGTGGSARLAYLPAREADELRARLLALSHRQPEETPEPDERVLATVPLGRLVASTLYSSTGLSVAAWAAVIIVAWRLAPGYVAASASGGLFAYVIGWGQVLWRRFNAGYRLTVAEAPDGLRLRSGLVETAAETIPRGRVQALRLTEPFLWRPLGWVHLSADIAGHQRRHGENRGEAKQLRTLLPVGTREEASKLVALILPSVPCDLSRPPRRARVKTPLRYRWLAWGRTDELVATTSGRVTKATDWIPLAKVQSLRRVQGPVQRRLRLATIHLDTAGRNVHAAIRDRDVREADEILVELTELARAARERATT